MQDSRQYQLEHLSTLSGNGETVWEQKVTVRDSVSSRGSHSNMPKDEEFSPPSRISAQTFSSLDSGDGIHTPESADYPGSAHSNDNEYTSLSVHSNDEESLHQPRSLAVDFNTVDKSDKPVPWHTHDAERDPNMHSRAKRVLTRRYLAKFRRLDEKYQKENGQSFGKVYPHCRRLFLI